MKNAIFSIVLACVMPLVLSAQVRYTLKGKVGNINEPAKMLLMYNIESGMKVDTAIMRHGRFSFNGNLVRPVQAVLILAHQKSHQVDYNSDGKRLVLEAGTIQLSSLDSVRNAKIIGGKLNKDYAELQQMLTSVSDKDRQMALEYDQMTVEQRKDSVTMKTRSSRRHAIEKERRMLYKQFIETHPNSPLSLDVMPMAVDSRSEYNDLRYLYNVLSTPLKNSQEGKDLKHKLDRLKTIAVGSEAPDFIQNDTTGHPVQLSSFRGRYVLLDFWASWCGPCRAENPNLVKSFNKYKDKNFTILGVSLDKSNGRDRWLQAIKDDRLNWTHVSDLGFWNNEVAKMYEVNSIPQNFLIDPSGKIIAKDLKGETLDKVLGEVLN